MVAAVVLVVVVFLDVVIVVVVVVVVSPIWGLVYWGYTCKGASKRFQQGFYMQSCV